jgi:hypothetical protein
MTALGAEAWRGRRVHLITDRLQTRARRLLRELGIEPEGELP